MGRNSGAIIQYKLTGAARKEGPSKMQETDLQTHADMEGKSSPMHRTKATAAQQNKTKQTDDAEARAGGEVANEGFRRRY